MTVGRRRPSERDRASGIDRSCGRRLALQEPRRSCRRPAPRAARDPSPHTSGAAGRIRRPPSRLTFRPRRREWRRRNGARKPRRGRARPRRSSEKSRTPPATRSAIQITSDVSRPLRSETAWSRTVTRSNRSACRHRSGIGSIGSQNCK
jgi:hypothetical protein